MVTYAKISPKMVNPRDIAGERRRRSLGKQCCMIQFSTLFYFQKATILENDYEEASVSLNNKYNTTADARERASSLAERADRILKDTLRRKNQLEGWYTLMRMLEDILF